MELPTEPVIALDELRSKEARTRPLELAMETVVAAFAGSNVTQYMAKAGHEDAYMRALLAMFRSRYKYEVHELHDFSCVALTREVNRPGQSRADSSRAEASDNVEPGRQAEAQQQVDAASSGAVDRYELQTAVAAGSLNRLLALGVPRLEAEMYVHLKPERLEAAEQLKTELMVKQQRFMQEHGPLLHLHFFATLPGSRNSGMGRAMLQHLEHQADTEGRHLYLEASTELSRRLYLRHGFRDVDRFELGSAGSGITVYIMARPPKQGPRTTEQ